MDHGQVDSVHEPKKSGDAGNRPTLIVVVEDDQAVAELTAEVLNEEPGYHAVAVSDGLLALELIRSMRPNLVLTDVRLPGLGGLELYDALRADAVTAAIPIIFMPASRFSAEFAERGIDRPLMKPFDISELLSRVAEALSS